MKDKILIFGKGYIGTRIQGELGCDISNERIFSIGDAQKEIAKFKPRIIINCIGYVGSNVDACEKEPDKSLFANTFVPVILGEAALRSNIKLVHISSGCVFHYDYNKDKPIDEKKIPDFSELFYSRTKIYSEQALKLLTEKYRHLIIRIRVPLDNRPHPRNLLTKLIGYKKVIDVPNSVTYIPDFISALKHLIKINASGIYNVVNKRGLKYPDLMDTYRKYVPDFKYELIDFYKLNLVRTNLVLSVKKLANSGFKVRPIKLVLEECVKDYLKDR